MFPNPQDSLPLPKRPRLETFNKHAQALVRAAKTGDDAISDWASKWVNAMVKTSGIPKRHLTSRTGRWISQLRDYATAELQSNPTLSKARMVVARSIGFATWRKFTQHVRKFSQPHSPTAQFETAADAIVNGDAAHLKTLLARNPELVYARSGRDHHATPLNYVSANGVESYRQRTPKNIAKIAKLLLDSGAEIDAVCEVYGSHCTTLGLAATSVHPAKAGVMNELLQLLLDYGADTDKKGSAGRARTLVFACLANGRLESAQFLAEKGAPVDIVSAAALDRIEIVKQNFDSRGTRKPGLSKKLLQEAFRYACGYGANRVIRFLLEHGADLTEHSGDGQTGTHYAVIFGRLDTLKLLLKYNPPLEAKNMYGGSVLGQTLWSAAHGGDPHVYAQIIETLIAAGANVPERHAPINPQIDALLLQYGSHPEPKWWWYGEEPASNRRAGNGTRKR
jgi:ankyrin repeat protein